MSTTWVLKRLCTCVHFSLISNVIEWALKRSRGVPVGIDTTPWTSDTKNLTMKIPWRLSLPECPWIILNSNSLYNLLYRSALTFLVLQRPRCRGLTRHQLFRIVRHSLASCLIQLLWLFGLSLCGPLRTTLIFEHSPLVIAAAGSALFRNVGGPSKVSSVH